MVRWHRLVFASLLAALAAAPAHAADTWHVHASEHFQIYCCRPADAASIGEACEKLLAELCANWQAGQRQPTWSERCLVVVHPTATAYLQAVGSAGKQTLGSAAIGIAGGKVSSRRIDLRGDTPAAAVDALPHELTHVVIADFFADLQLPRWADEGIALLADPTEKQLRHRQDLQTAFDRRLLLPIGALLIQTELLSGTARAAFYGQSASLVDYLLGLGTPEEFVSFVRTGAKHGYDTALQQSYGIESVAQLDQMWKRHLATGPSPTTRQAPIRPAAYINARN